MQVSLLALLGISLVAMFFGYFFGLFEGRGQGYKKRRQEEASDPALRAALQPPPPPPPPAPKPVAPAPTPIVQPQPSENTLLRLALDASQQPCLDLDGARIDTTRMEPQQRRRLIDLMVLMRPWIEAGPLAPQKSAPVAPLPPATPAATIRATVPPFDGQQVRSAPASVLAGTPPEEPVSAPTTMVGQIDAILQTRIAGTPLAGRGIRLVESMQGGALVVVGLNRYPGVADVPDPEVQAAIRAAIAEWENRYTPG
jgi:hypothetical protein